MARVEREGFRRVAWRFPPAPTGPATPTSEVTTDAESDEESGNVRRGELDASESVGRELNFLQQQSG
eukprot:5901506-Alexandrium_andersonii.AAC.1